MMDDGRLSPILRVCVEERTRADHQPDCTLMTAATGDVRPKEIPEAAKPVTTTWSESHAVGGFGESLPFD